LETQKGHAYLFDAWPAVVREFPDARLLVVGDGSLRGTLEQRARGLGITGNVVFTGFRSDVARVLDTIDALVLPSLYEGMPLTAIEASAMARPVVATAVDGTPEVVEDGVTGYLVPPAEPEALARSLVRVLADRDRASRSSSRPSTKANASGASCRARSRSGIRGIGSTSSSSRMARRTGPTMPSSRAPIPASR